MNKLKRSSIMFRLSFDFVEFPGVIECPMLMQLKWHSLRNMLFVTKNTFLNRFINDGVLR